MRRSRDVTDLAIRMASQVGFLLTSQDSVMSDYRRERLESLMRDADDLFPLLAFPTSFGSERAA